MVAAVNPVKLLVYVPVDVPSVVFVERAMVGVEVVDQTIPLIVTAAPPLLVMLPPLNAVVFVIDETIAVGSRVGSTADVVKLISVP